MCLIIYEEIVKLTNDCPMKKQLIILALLFFSLPCVVAQDVTLHFENVKLGKVLSELERKTGYTFSYSSQVVDSEEIISIDVANLELSLVLKKIFTPLNVLYKIEGKKILLSNGNLKVKKISSTKRKTISGQVIDKLGSVIGASVFVKGTTNGTNTDLDGNFTLSDVPENATIEVSYVGYKTQELPANSNFSKIILKEDSQLLGEVIVTGITSTDKRLFTGASDKLEADNVKLDGIPDISRALEGRAAGVSVQNVSGTFGAAPKIRVRGATSIYGSSKPLWVVDGVIMEDVVEMSADDLSSGDVTTLISSAIAGLNPDDIESFEVLKDGSATSIYGARAMAGVIVITTKKGRAGVSSINYTGEYTYREIPRYGDFNIMNSQEQMSVYEEMRNAGWLNYADLATARESGVYGRMYKQLNKLNSDGTFVLENTPAAKAAFLRQAEYRNTDWFKELFQNNIMQSHSISMSSGTEKSAYYASLSALLDPGWSLASNVNRYTANFKANFKIRDNLTLTAISSGAYRKQKAPGTLSQDTDVVTGKVKRDFDINPYSFALNSSRALDPNAYYTRNFAPFNIKEELEENFIELNVTDVKFQTELSWKPIREIEFKALGAIKYQATSQEHNITEFSNQAEAYRAMGTSTIRDKNPFLYKDPDNPYAIPISVLPQGGIYERTDYRMLSYDFRATGAYKKTINNIHTLNAYLGSEVNSTDRRNTSSTGWGMQYSTGEIPFYTYELFKKGIENNNLYYSLGNTNYRNVAIFSNVTYSWKHRYTLNGTLRYEGTNKMGKSNNARWLPTWNISGAWNMHQEDFFSKQDFVSHLTLKTSYSLTADRGPHYVTNSLVDIRSLNPWRPTAEKKETSLGIVALENSELTYEKKKEFNVGANIGFLNDRVNFAIDWYTRDNYDLIGITTTQGVGGSLYKYGNVATMKSNGFELSLNTNNVKTKDFSWATSFVYSHTNNEVTQLDNMSRVVDLVTGSGFAREGYPVRAIFSIPFKGLNEEGLPTFLNKNGDITVSDIYFQERENIDFLEYSGNADPTDVGSLSNVFKYKGFNLNIFMTYAFGNVIRLNPIFNYSYSDMTALPKEFKNRWVLPGDEKYTDIPLIATTRQAYKYGRSTLATVYNAYNYSSTRIAKGDFIRMKEIALGYDFPKTITSTLGLNSLSLKLQATNLFLIYADDKLNGQDPEFFNSGGVSSPIPKQWTFTVRVGL